jgi:glutamate-5-semialdehyde dehydrogenase
VQTPNMAELMLDMGRRARAAAQPLALASPERKHAALIGMAQAIIRDMNFILAANALDMEAAEEAGLSPASLDRLKLNETRIRGIADSVRAIAEFKDPIGEVITEWDRPNGLHIERVRTPLKAGNPVILRGGSDSIHSSEAIHACMVEGLKSASLPEDAIQRVPVTDRAAVGEMLKGLGGNLDVIVPRGGRSLVERIQNDARVPVFAHLEGICHVYVGKDADPKMAREIVLNAKMRRTGVCGAAECLLIDWQFYTRHGAPMIEDLLKAGCEVRAEGELQKITGTMKAAPEDFGHEFLDKIIAARLVEGVDEAISHINRYSSHHTEAVITEDAEVAEKFMNEIDSAILLHNASTQFADGGEFGMGGEIGIATGRMHARGPVGVEQLTSFKYRVRGTGQTRR